MDIIAVSVVCIASAIIAKVIQPTNRDLAALLSITAVVVVAAVIIGDISEVIYGLLHTVESAGIKTDYISISFKALGICYVSEIASSSCRDCGESALAGIVDISARVAVALVCLPLVKSFIDVIQNILEV